VHRGTCLLGLLLAGPARADDARVLHGHLVDDGPLLDADPALRFDPVEGVTAITAERHITGLALGSRARAGAETRVWSEGFPISDDRRTYGWTAAGKFDVELAWGVHLEVDASLMKLAPQMNGMFGDGLVAGFGVALKRYLRWSGGRVAWIMLGVEHTEYVGDKVVGTPHGTTVGLAVGTTF